MKIIWALYCSLLQSNNLVHKPLFSRVYALPNTISSSPCVAQTPRLQIYLLICFVSSYCLFFVQDSGIILFWVPKSNVMLAKVGLLIAFAPWTISCFGVSCCLKVRDLCFIVMHAAYIAALYQKGNHFSQNITVLCSTHKFIFPLLLSEYAEDHSGFSEVHISIFLQEFVVGTLCLLLAITQKCF